MANLLPFLLVDAFECGPFTGNPAGVCFLHESLEDAWLQNVAMEMNQAETAFLLPHGDGYSLRWFTPTTEVDLCGHATLASAHALWATERLPWEQPAYFDTRSGRLSAEWTGSQISLDFPAEPVQAREVDPSALGVPVTFSGENRMDWLFEVSDETTVRELQPDLKGLSELGKRGVIVTAPASRPGYDFVSRFFAPAAGVDEDPVTGSAHCALGPYWASKLGQVRVTGFQASPRGGIVRVEVLGDRVRLLGTARTVVEGVLTA